MRASPIRTEAQYDAALKAIGRYFDSPPPKGTVDADMFDNLAALIEAYEQEHWPIDPPPSRHGRSPR